MPDSNAAATKRFCTLQVLLRMMIVMVMMVVMVMMMMMMLLKVTISGGDEHPPLAVIFRGKGGVLAKERASYRPLLKDHVYFQAKAWFSSERGAAWIEKDLKPCVEEKFGGKKWVLYCDNLYAQRTNAFVSTAKSLNGQSIYGS